MSKSLPDTEGMQQGQVTRPAPPHPLLVAARKALRRWDLSLECSGLQSWIETTGSRKRLWLIIPGVDGTTTFEEIDKEEI